MLRTETYHTSDAIKFLNHASGQTNVVVCDNKQQLQHELYAVVDELDVGEFFCAILISDGEDALEGIRDAENRLVRLKYNGEWYSTKLLQEGTVEDEA